MASSSSENVWLRRGEEASSNFTSASVPTPPPPTDGAAAQPASSMAAASSSGIVKRSKQPSVRAGRVVADAAGGRRRRPSGKTAATVPICHFFQKGTCRMGATCRFQHPTADDVSSTTMHVGASAFVPQQTLQPHHSRNTTNGSTFVNDSSQASKGLVPPPTTTRNYTRKEFCPYKAEAIRRTKMAQDNEARPWWQQKQQQVDQGTIDSNNIAGENENENHDLWYGMDVECVATGYGHGLGPNHRRPVRVALVDSQGTTLLDQVISQDPSDVKSYLTPLTGLTRADCTASTTKTLLTFDETIQTIQRLLPSNAILVGQSIQHDIDWLGLEKGRDFADSIDICDIFRQRIPKNIGSAGNAVKREKENTEVSNHANKTEQTNDNTGRVAINISHNNSGDWNETGDDEIGFPTRYRVFSLRHCCIHLLGVDMQSDVHDPVDDARYSLQLFHKYRNAPAPMLRAIRDSLHRAPATASFSTETPVIDGVCLGPNSYRFKHAARFIYAWWTHHKTK